MLRSFANHYNLENKEYNVALPVGDIAGIS